MGGKGGEERERESARIGIERKRKCVGSGGLNERHKVIQETIEKKGNKRKKNHK